MKLAHFVVSNANVCQQFIEEMRQMIDAPKMYGPCRAAEAEMATSLLLQAAHQLEQRIDVLYQDDPSEWETTAWRETLDLLNRMILMAIAETQIDMGADWNDDRPAENIHDITRDWDVWPCDIIAPGNE